MKLRITLFLFAMSFTAISQTTIKGTVYDDIGPLLGANIIIKDSKIGVVSNTKGYFEIQAKKGDVIVVSYLGYETKETVITNQNQINLKLEGSIAFDEIKIVVYGTISCSHIIKCYNIYKTACGFDVTYATQNNSKSEIIKEKLFPNPSKNGHFKLNFLKPYKHVQIQINNISGQQIKASSYQDVNKEVRIDLSQYPAGIYIINIIADGKRLSPKKAIRG